jgi:two-component system, sensor histidine kinase
LIYQALFEHASDGMLIVNSDRLCIEANAAAAAILGFDRAALIRRRIEDLLFPEATEAFATVRHNFLQAGTAQGEIGIRRPDGTRRRVEYSATAHVVNGLHMVIFRDVTERHQAATDLEKLSRRLADAEAIAHLGHWECTATGRQVFWSDELVRILGLVPGHIQPSWEAFLTQVHPEDKAALVDFHQGGLNGEGLPEIDYRIVRPDGTIRQLRSCGRAVTNGDGTVVGLLGTAQDITDLKLVEQALREQAENLQAIMEAVPAIVFLAHDPECRRISGSNTAYEALRVPRSANLSLTGIESDKPKGFRVLIDGCEPSPDQLPVQRAARGEEIRHWEEQVIFDDGSALWLYGHATPLRHDQGHVRGAVAAFMDVTALRQAESALRSAKEQAERANVAKSKFLAAASHDLRQPLQSLLLFAALLNEHVGSAKGRDILAHLAQSLTAMKDLLDSLLDISQLDAGVVQPTLEDFSLRSFLEEIAAGFAPVAAAKGLTLEVTPCTAIVRSDRTLLGRMVRNLVENAIRYTETGRICLLGHRIDGNLRLEVHDTGIGIPPDHLDRVWEEFHQVGNPERNRAQGLGLGLAIVQRLSQLLGHRAAVRSHPGHGSVFSLEVPVSIPETVSRTPFSVPTADGGGQCAMLVDDDPLVLQGLQTTLEAWGYDVLAAASADQALEQLRAAGRRPDVVIADYQLGGGRFGIEAVLRIRALFDGAIPGVILTGETGSAITHAAALDGLVVLHKPVTPQTLNAVLTQQR